MNKIKKSLFIILAVLISLVLIAGSVSADEPQKRNVIYVVNGLSYTVHDIEVGSIYEVESYKPTGYTLSEWKSDDVAIIDGKFTMPNKDVTISATKTPNKYNITYNLNGGRINGNYDTYYEYGKIHVLPIAVSKDGCNFEGWYDNEKCTGNKITQIGDKETGEKTFYAKYSGGGSDPSPTGETYQITYMVRDTPYIEKGIKAGTYITPPQYTLTGYTIKSWTSNDVFIENGQFLMPNKNVTINAVVTPMKYRITYYLNNGIINGSYNTEYEHGTAHVLPVAVSRGSEQFKGWYENPTFIGNPVTQIGAEATGDKTFYAKFSGDDQPVTPTPSTPTNSTTGGNVPTQNTAQKASSPFPIIGVLAGLGITALICIRHK